MITLTKPTRKYKVFKRNYEGAYVYGITTGSCGPCHTGVRGFRAFKRELLDFKNRNSNTNYEREEQSLHQQLPPGIEELSLPELIDVTRILEGDYRTLAQKLTEPIGDFIDRIAGYTSK